MYRNIVVSFVAPSTMQTTEADNESNKLLVQVWQVFCIRMKIDYLANE